MAYTWSPWSARRGSGEPFSGRHHVTDQTINSRLSVPQELDRLASEYVAAVEARDGGLPTVPYDPEWESVAVVGRACDEQMFWQPALRHDSFSFEAIASALEAELPKECDEYFGHFWSGAIPVIWDERPFELLQLWNHDDENNLMHNILGHSLEKKRVKEPLTVFFALVDDARFLSVDAESGVVVLEEVGGGRPEEVASDLASLLSSVTAVAGSGADA